MRVLMVTHRQFNIQTLDNSTVTIMPVRHENLGHCKETSLPSLSCGERSGCLLGLLLALLERGKSFRAEERMNEDSVNLPRRRDGTLLLVLGKNDKELFSFITKIHT